MLRPMPKPADWRDALTALPIVTRSGAPAEGTIVVGPLEGGVVLLRAQGSFISPEVARRLARLLDAAADALERDA